MINKVYKGTSIYKLMPYGYYEMYCNKQKRFIKFDNLETIKNYIDNEHNL